MNLRLLIVEADEQVRRWLGLHIGSLWPEARLDYATQAEAWQAVKSAQQVDLMLLGLGRADSEREQTWRLLTRTRKLQPAPPVVIIASGGNERLAVNSMRRGASDYLAREALSPAELGRALHEALQRDQQRARRAAQAQSARQIVTNRAAQRDQVPHYRLLRKLGGSNSATVWLARSEQLGRPVALKVGGAGVDDPEARRQLAEERAAIARLRHPAVVELYDYGVHEGREFLAMEYFPCGDLKQRLANPLSPQRALQYARDIAQSLSAVHAAGFMHRDLKPHNVMLRADGSVVLIDFGLARALSSQTHLTAAGVLRGSPYYMSPEQANGLPLDARSDLYSLGVMLFEMLAGHRPYVGNSALELMEQHVNGLRPRLPEDLARYEPLVDQLMAVDRTQRCTTAAEAVALLESSDASIRDATFIVPVSEHVH